MKKFSTTLLLILVSTFVFSQGRNVDLGIRVLKPETGDSVNSPQDYTATFSITNYGPDTARYNDFIYVEVLYGNIVWKYPGRGLLKNLGPGDSMLYNASFKMKFDRTNWKVPFCGTITKILSSSPTDTINKEKTATLVNNQHCVLVDHIVMKSGLNLISDEKIKIYPNPAKHFITIELPTNTFEFIKVEIIEYTGRILRASEHKSISGLATIDCNNLAKGLYYVQVTAGNQRILRKIVVE